jgi:hypothetical protein
LLAGAVLALGVGVLLLANGGLGFVGKAIGSTFNGLITSITATPVPSASPPSVADAPALDAPDEPYTNQPTVDLSGTVPAPIAGDTTSRIRIYVAIGNGKPGVVTEIPVGLTQHFTVPHLTLSPGANTFTATIVGPTNLESEASAAATYILDMTKPKITISAPKNNAVVNGKTVKVIGQTQARSTINVRNATTNVTVNGQADGKGAFAIVLPLGTSVNQIQVTATDPAGNVNTATLAVRRGTGHLSANLTASFYQIRLSRLPKAVVLNVVVTDPDGRTLAGASVTFTLAVPGVSAITSSVLTTDADGKATFTTTIPKGATAGTCTVTVIVQTTDFGGTTDRTVITLQK